MKKISVIAFVLSTVLSVNAQNTFSPTFGIKGGLNLAQFKTNDYPTGTAPDVSWKKSAHAGIFMNAPLGKGGLAIQPELLYSRQGSKITQTTTVGTITQTSDYDQDLSYITLPIMLQWKTAAGVFVETGPQPGYLIKGKQDGPGSTEADNKSSFDNFDLSWGAGIGYVSKIGLGIGARYNYGLTNTIEDGGGNNSANNGPELKNSVIQIGLSWRFGNK
jgi:Outer membrane protein beta-barrel domain